MSSKPSSAKLQTHGFDQTNFDKKLSEIRERLNQAGDTKQGTLTNKLAYLQQLTEFEFGRFMISNGGLNGRWSHYAFYEYPRFIDKNKIHPLELRILESPFQKSNRERISLVQSILLPELFEGISILSVPCGVMADLTSLDYTKISDFSVTGVDLDNESLKLARSFAEQHKKQNNIHFERQDAWNLKFESNFDIVVSLGLNMYSPSLDIAMQLYKTLFSQLKRGGKLIISFLTPDISSPDSERDVTLLTPEEIDRQDIAREVLQIKYQQHTCTSKQIVQYLKEAGFSSVSCYYSKFRAFNIAVATK